MTPNAVAMFEIGDKYVLLLLLCRQLSFCQDVVAQRLLLKLLAKKDHAPVNGVAGN